MRAFDGDHVSFSLMILILSLSIIIGYDIYCLLSGQTTVSYAVRALFVAKPWVRVLVWMALGILTWDWFVQSHLPPPPPNLPK